MRLGNRYSQHSFAQIPDVKTARSKFNRSFAIKDTFNFDLLTPFYVEEILPGDTLNINVKSFMRLATQAVPVMDNMYVDFFFFFVPNRLTWENWERMNGSQDNPSDPVDFLVPYIEAPVDTGFEVGSIYDHLGIPTGVPEIQVNALPFRACNLIWNEWFRDQNLQNSLNVPKGDGPDTYTTYELQYRAKKHDYFTSALPWPQKGASVGLPLVGKAYITSETGTINVALPDHSAASQLMYEGANDNNIQAPMLGGVNPFNTVMWPDGTEPGGDARSYADLTTATAATINQFRQAMMMQSLLELDARGGTRYVEILRAHFNVISPDFRLQRPEFLSSGTVPIQQHPVAQNSASVEGGTPQANLAAFSTVTALGNKIGFSKSFTEHGYVIGFLQARADVTYQQGLNRMWSRRTRWDFFWPKFQELGEQAILNKEIFCQGNQNDDGVFGYQERHADYRYRPSEIRGQFRSDYAESLDVWHLAEEFDTLPALNGTFIKSNTPIERVLVVPEQDYPHLLADFFIEQTHARPMMTYGVPATLGRF